MKTSTLTKFRNSLRIQSLRHGLAALILLFSVPLLSQPSMMFAKQLGGSSSDEGTGVATDAAGNIYLTGNFQGVMDLDPGPASFTVASAGDDDVYLVKLNTSGDFVWGYRLGGNTQDFPTDITLDNSGNIYLSGYFWGTSDYDPGPGSGTITSHGDYDAFVVKLDASGSFVWARNLGGIGRDGAQSVAVDNGGNVLVAGNFSGTGDFDPGAGTYTLAANGAWADAYVAKLNSSGNLAWVRSFGGNYVDAAFAVASDNSGNVYVGGYFNNSLDMDPGPGVVSYTSAGAHDIYLLKLDASGIYQWSAQMGGTGYDQIKAIAVDNSGNVFSTGYYDYAGDFDPGAGTFNLNGGFIFLSKLNSSGNFVWAKSLAGGGGGFYGSEGNAIVVDGLGNITIAGTMAGTIDFDPGDYDYLLSSAGSDDIFVARYDGSGNFMCAARMGGAAIDIGTSLALDASGNMISTGKFNGTADFDPAAGSFTLMATQDDVFVSKLASCMNIGMNENRQEVQLELFPNPSSGDFNVRLGRELRNTGAVWVQICDVMGRPVYNSMLTDGEATLRLNTSLQNGVYLLQLTSGATTLQKEIILMR